MKKSLFSAHVLLSSCSLIAALLLSLPAEKTFALPLQTDSLAFPRTQVGVEICSTFLYIDTGAKPCNVLSVTTEKNAGNFSVASTDPTLPLNLKTGDTLKITVCFRPQDTTIFQDILKIQTACFNVEVPLSGYGGTGLIDATDIDFGDVIVGTHSCKDITVRNIGSLPFTLTKNWLLHNTSVFSMEPASEVLLPVKLEPGGKGIALTFCYSPMALGSFDSTTIDWNTDIPAPFTELVKSRSYINHHSTGHPIRPGLISEIDEEDFVEDSSSGISSITKRIYFANEGTSHVHIAKIFVQGMTASEFAIAGDELGKIPLENFDLNTGDSMWVDVVFTPDLTKPYPDRYADRVDSMVAVSSNVFPPPDSTFLKLVGTWIKSDVKTQPQFSAFSIRPNPTSAKSITVSFSLLHDDNVECSIFDELGREVYRDATIASHILGAGNHEEVIMLPNLEAGTYYLRLRTGSIVKTQKLEIIK